VVNIRCGVGAARPDELYGFFLASSPASLRPEFRFLQLLATLLVLACGALIFVVDRQSHRHIEREAALRHAGTVIRGLSSKIDDLEFVGERFANHLRWTPAPGPRELKMLSEGFLKKFPFIHSIAFAPNLRVSRVFPETAAPPPSGADYHDDPATMAIIKKAIVDRNPGFEVRPRKEGSGEKYRLHYPVFVTGPNGASDVPWGVVTFGVAADLLLPDISDPASEFPGARVLLEVTRPGDHDYTAVAGDRTVIDDSPESVAETVLGTRWRVSVMPEAGWEVWPHSTPWIVGGTLLSVALANLLIVTIRGLSREKNRSRFLLYDAMQALDQGILIFDQQGCLVAANHQASGELHDIVGQVPLDLTLEQILRRQRIHQRGTTELAAEDEAWIQDRLMRHGEGRHTSTVQVRDDLWLKVSEVRTRTGHFVRAYQDVTLEKQAQLDAEEASRKKGEFMGKVSHELRTPLTVIGGYAQLIRQIPDPDVARKNAERISRAASHMERLVEDLLDWTDIKRGLVLELEDFSIDALAAEVGEDLQMLAREKGLTLEIRTSPAMACGDRDRVKQVLYNLVENAIRFTPAGRVLISVTREAEGVRVAVADTGIGIAETARASVFEEFNQADNSDARPHNGLGLGLAIAQKIVEGHGSRIEVSGKYGTGACFHFHLPPADHRSTEPAWRRTA